MFFSNFEGLTGVSSKDHNKALLTKKKKFQKIFERQTFRSFTFLSSLSGFGFLFVGLHFNHLYYFHYFFRLYQKTIPRIPFILFITKPTSFLLRKQKLKSFVSMDLLSPRKEYIHQSYQEISLEREQRIYQHQSC